MKGSEYMYILFDITESLRSAALWLDTIAFSLIDNVYDLFYNIASQEIITDTVIGAIAKNMYVIVGIFAFFRIAVFLVNSIISPDALFKSETGLSKIFVNMVIMLVLLVFTPILFDKSRDISEAIVKNQYIERLFIDVSSDTSKLSLGQEMQKIAITGVITPNEQFADPTDLEPVSTCNDDCKKAINCLRDLSGKNKPTQTDCVNSNGKVSWTQLAIYNGVKQDKVYVYNYKPLVLTVVGWVMTYIIFSFTFDVAKRTIELALLEMLSPLFIATIIDPKSMKSGPFNKWLKAVGTSYASLFIRIAAISLLLLCTKILMLWDTSGISVGGIGKLVILFGFLIFVKQLPTWLSNLIGISSENTGLSGIGIGKKLAGAALVGGAIGKAKESATSFAKKKGKNFVGHRAQEIGAAAGSVFETHRENRKKINDPNYQKKRYSDAWKAAKAKTRAENFGKDSNGFFNDAKAGFSSGRLNVNADAKSWKEKQQTKLDEKNNRLNNPEEKAKVIKKVKEANEARENYQNAIINSDNSRGTVDRKGKDVNLVPVGPKEMNESWDNPISEEAAYLAHGNNLIAASNGSLNINSSGQVVDTKGKVIANSVSEYGASQMTYSGRLAAKALVAENVSKDVANFQKYIEQRSEISNTYTSEVRAYKEEQTKLLNKKEYSSAVSVVDFYEKNIRKRDDAGKTILSIKNNPDYTQLSSLPYANLTAEEQKRLHNYNLSIKAAENDINTSNTNIKTYKNAYDSAKITIDKMEKDAGIETMKINCENSKKQLDVLNKEIKNYEDKFKNAESYKFDGNTRTSEKEKPYEVKINGVKHIPGTDPTTLINMQEITQILSEKADKARDKRDKNKASKDDKK